MICLLDRSTDGLYFYADLYMILNVIMNLFLIWVTSFIRRKQYTPFRWGIAALFVAVLSLLHKVRSLEEKIIMPDFFYCMFSILLLAGLSYKYSEYKKVNKLLTFIQDVAVLMFNAVLTAGALLVFKEHIGIQQEKGVKKAFVLTMISFVILCALFLMMRNIIKNEAKRCELIINAELIHDNLTKNVNVLYDTGNNLFSPYTNEPVNIISKEVADNIGISKKQNPLLVPYGSIGGSGMLETFRFEKLVFQNGETMMNFLGAVSEKLDENSDVDMILNCSCKKIKKQRCKKEDKNGKSINTKQISI